MIASPVMQATNAPPFVPLRVELVAEGVDQASLYCALQSDHCPIDLVGCASSESEALRIFFGHAADVVVLDVRLVELEPARLLGMFRRIAPNAITVALVPSRDCPAARAVAAVGPDRIATPATLGLVMAELSRERCC